MGFLINVSVEVVSLVYLKVLRRVRELILIFVILHLEYNELGLPNLKGKSLDVVHDALVDLLFLGLQALEVVGLLEQVFVLVVLRVQRLLAGFQLVVRQRQLSLQDRRPRRYCIQLFFTGSEFLAKLGVALAQVLDHRVELFVPDVSLVPGELDVFQLVAHVYDHYLPVFLLSRLLFHVR